MVMVTIDFETILRIEEFYKELSREWLENCSSPGSDTNLISVTKRLITFWCIFLFPWSLQSCPCRSAKISIYKPFSVSKPYNFVLTYLSFYRYNDVSFSTLLAKSFHSLKIIVFLAICPIPLHVITVLSGDRAWNLPLPISSFYFASISSGMCILPFLDFIARKDLRYVTEFSDAVHGSIYTNYCRWSSVRTSERIRWYIIWGHFLYIESDTRTWSLILDSKYVNK